MRTLVRTTQPLADLGTALARARRRWRLRHVALGAAVVVAALGVTIWGTAVVLERYRFTPASVLWARIFLGLVTAVAGVRWLLYPMLRRITDDRFALYLEERVPSLDGAVISAVEVWRRPVPEETRSPMLERGLVADAARRLEGAVEVAQLERSLTARGAVLTACMLAGLAAMLLVGPAYVRQGARLMFTPWKHPAAAAVYSIAITPGDANVARGADVQVDAALGGFTADLVEVVIRRGKSAEWERIAMGPGTDSASYRARLFDVSEDAEYFVEASGVRSEVGRLTVRDLPGVNGVSVSLRYPAYTGLPPETLPDGGDIAALAGTRATVAVHATRAVRGGRLVLDDGKTKIELRLVDDTTLATTIVINRDGFYRVELDAEDGTRVPGTVEYVVDALEDGAPTITITKPGRDVRPSPVDEVLIEAQASDDFGVGRMELVYRVNGGEENVVTLTEGGGRRAREMTAGHTLFLEEITLEPGDVIAYYARTWDNSPPRRRAGSSTPSANKAASDIYFLTVRPFGRDFRQNQQGGGGGGGQQGDMNPGALVATQREIISATFKAQRDSLDTQARTLREDVATIHLSQGRLRERVEQLIQRLQRPAVQAADSGFRKLAELMPLAKQEMQGAEERLAKVELTDAMPPEQRALQWLERAEAVFREVQVSMQQGGGGGGGGQDANASDLADLLELENDKLRNQYEQVQRSQQQQAQQEVDETLERLKRLAARQQQENERLRQGGRPSSGGGGGGGSQRQLAEETEQLARQLERLAREERSPEMQETARRLQDAANQMRRSAAQGSASGQGSGGTAAAQLDQARRLLEEARQGRTAGAVQDAARRAETLAEQQREVSREVSQMGQGAANAERDRRTDERKRAMAEEVGALERDLERMARDPQSQQSGAANGIRDAAGAIRRNRIGDRIQFSRESMRSPSRDYANNVEGQIQADLDSLTSRLSRVAGRASAGADSAQRSSRALAQARDLVRGLASIEDRMRERLGQRGAAGQPGEQPGQGQGASQAGQQGSGQPSGPQPAQRGLQPGQPDRQGQAGQAGQPGGQGGQRGQGGREARGGGQGSRGSSQGQAAGSPNEGGGMPGARQPGGRMGGQGQGGPGGGFTAEDARQFARELRSQRESAEGLRRDLAGTGTSTADLDRLIQRLRQLESGRTFDDPEELERLRGAVIEGFKEFEFGLRRQLGARDRDGPVLGGSDDVPQAYRDLVSEYFRSLSRRGRAP